MQIHLLLLLFFNCFEVEFLLSGAGGEPSHDLRVSYSGDQSRVCSV